MHMNPLASCLLRRLAAVRFKKTGRPLLAGLAAVALLGSLPAPAHALSAMAMKALCTEPAKGTGKADEAAKQALAGDAAFELRKDEAKAREAVAAYEASLAADANQPELRIKLVRVLYLLADGYYRLAEKEDEMLDAFERGVTNAGAALQQVNPSFRRKICSGGPIPEAIATLDRASVAPMYWFATHVGKYGLAKDLLEVLANKDMIFAAMDALKRLNPSYYYHAPDRYLGGYYTKVPFPKGDLPTAFQHFRLSMKGSPNYLATYNLVAEMYAPRVIGLIAPKSERCVVDSPKLAEAGKYHPCRAFFEKLLRHVLDAKPEILPDLAPEQAVEQEKAKKLLAEIDTFFPPL